LSRIKGLRIYWFSISLLSILQHVSSSTGDNNSGKMYSAPIAYKDDGSCICIYCVVADLLLLSQLFDY